MNAEDLRVEVLGMLADIRSAGRGASRSDIGRILDRRLPSLVANHDAVAGVSMSDVFRLRLGEAVSDACAAARERLEAQVVDGNAMPRRTPSRMRTLGWALAAAAVLLIGMWLYGLIAPRGQIVAPKVTPPVTGPEKPIVPRMERKPPGPNVQIEPGKRQRSVDGPVKPVPKRDSGKVAVKEPPAIGEITSIEGEPQVRAAPDKMPKPVALGMKLGPGSIIETGDLGKAVISLEDGSTLTLLENGVLAAKVDGKGEIEAARNFLLTSGTLVAQVASTMDQQTFTVETPVATAEVLATEFSLGIKKVRAGTESKLSALLQVKSGRVSFYNDIDRKGVVATAMTESIAVAGAAPTQPKRISSLKVFTFDWSGHRAGLEVKTERLHEEDAGQSYVFPRGWIGIKANTLSNGDVRIVEVLEGSPARQAGLRGSDIVRTVNGQAIHSDAMIHRTVWASPGKVVRLSIERNRQLFDVDVLANLDRPTPTELPRALANRLYEATWLAMSGNVGEGSRLLKELAEEDPHPAVFNNLGVALESQDQMEAVFKYQSAVRAESKTPLYHYNLGRALKKIGKQERSAEEFEAAIALDPDYHDAILALAEEYDLLGLHEESLALIDSALPRFPDCPHMYLSKMASFRHLGKPAKAIEAGKKAVEIDPYYGPAYHKLGITLSFAGLPVDADAAYQRAIVLWPEQPNVHNSRGLNFKDYGRPKEAEAELLRAIELDPNHSNALGTYGSLLHNLRRYSEAEVISRRAIAADPLKPTGYFNLGLTLSQLGKLDEAEEKLLKASERDPMDATIHEARAYVFYLQYKFAEVLRAYEAAVAIQPNDPHWLGLLGWSQIENHRWKEAVQTLRKGIANDPTNRVKLNSLNNLAYALIHLGDLRDAEVALTEALKLKPEDVQTGSNWALLLAHQGVRLDEALERAKKAATPNAYAARWQVLGFVHYKRGEFNDAIVWLEKAAKNEEYAKCYLAADTLVTLGQVYEAKKDIPAAISAYRRALGIESSNRAAAAALKRLEK